MKDKRNKTLKILYILELLFLALILLFTLLACLPTAKTAAGQNIFNIICAYLNSHSSAFYVVLCSLSFLAIIFHILRVYYINRSDEFIADAIQTEQDNGFAKIDNQIYHLSEDVHQLHVKFIKETSDSRAKMNINKDDIKFSYQHIAKTYNDNLRNYYECNKKIYKIVRKTQLESIEEIRNLIETYDKI